MVVPQVGECATLVRVGDQEVAELANRAFAAARAGDASSLETLVNEGVPVNLSNEAGDTLIMLAAYHGHAAAVSALVKLGGDANRANDRGQTPIAGAVFKAADEVVRALLDGGADPFAGTPSAVDTARMFGRAELLALFERKG
jgi:ankyrin repeat protein